MTLHIVVSLILYALIVLVAIDGGETDTLNAGQRYLVVRLHRLGLANRLRSMADLHLIATSSNRHMLISWLPTIDCNASFLDLFVSGMEGFSILANPLASHKAGIDELKDIADNSSLSFKYLDLDEEQYWISSDRFIVRGEEFFSDTEVVLTDYDGVISLAGISCQQYLYSRSNFLSSLVPHQRDIDFISDIQRNYFRTHLMVGIHYRSHDQIQDWEVVPPYDDSSQNAKKFGDGARLEDFEEVMNSIESHFNSGRIVNVEQKTNVRFYIASNTDDAKNYFMNKFTDSISLRGGEYSRHSKEGIRFALLEWLLLSECALIINTYGSSFAVEAGQRLMRPTVGIWGGKLLYHSDTRLHQCGHMQFMKFTSNDYSSYREGTEDNRIVDAKRVRLEQCNVLNDWGMQNIYCSSRT